MQSKLLLLVITLSMFACKNNTSNNSRVEKLPYYNEATFTPNWIDDGDKKLENFHKISPFSLLNQNGKEITEKDFDNKIYVVDFFFTICPGICPKMTANMMTLQEEFINNKDVFLLSHSVTPERDSVPVLKAYAEDKGISDKTWFLATGPEPEIYRLGRKDYFVEEDLGLEKEIDEFLHTENFVLVDKQKHIRGIYNGLNKTAIKQLIEDIKTLQKE